MAHRAVDPVTGAWIRLDEIRSTREVFGASREKSSASTRRTVVLARKLQRTGGTPDSRAIVASELTPRDSRGRVGSVLSAVHPSSHVEQW